MDKKRIEVRYEDEATVKFLRAETLYKNCIQNPNSKNCLTRAC